MFPCITVADPVQHTEGLKGKYIMYQVTFHPPAKATAEFEHDATPTTTTTIPLLFPETISVNRRYSDFCWLHDRLHRERPGAIVPTLPEKHASVASSVRFSEDFVEERRLRLESFLVQAASNPELGGADCLAAFLGGGEEEWKRIKKGGSGVGSPTARGGDGVNGAVDDDHAMFADDGEPSSSTAASSTTAKDMITNRKAGVKKWFAEKKTSMRGNVVRCQDDPVFEDIVRYVSALEAGLKRIQLQAADMAKRDGEAAAGLLDFGLGCEALGQLQDEGKNAVVDEDGQPPAAPPAVTELAENRETNPINGVIGKIFRLVGSGADAASSIHRHQHETSASSFHALLQQHLRTVGAAKAALAKRHERKLTYSTCVHTVETKKAALHKYRITPGMDNKAKVAEESLKRAEAAVEIAKVRFDDVSGRVLREMDRFQRQSAGEMRGAMLAFVKAQNEYYRRLEGAWGEILPGLEAASVSFGAACTGAEQLSYVEAAAARSGEENGGTSSGGHASQQATTTTAMITAGVAEIMGTPPLQPPPPVPASGVIQYRDPLPEQV